MTEKRPKLLKDISDPWRGEIKAGTIGEYLPRECAWRFFDGRGPSEMTVSIPSVGLGPGWFEWVDVCAECGREVCYVRNVETQICPSYLVGKHDHARCHGHEHAVCELCGDPPCPLESCSGRGHVVRVCHGHEYKPAIREAERKRRGDEAFCSVSRDVSEFYYATKDGFSEMLRHRCPQPCEFCGKKSEAIAAWNQRPKPLK